jgi:carboxymethylenebutenolidase
MSIYDAHHMEFTITSSQITIMTDDGIQVPAFLAHPQLGQKFSGIVLIHDWWGVNQDIRQLSNFLAQMGYYVIVPDLFEGQTAVNAKQAIELYDKHASNIYSKVNASLAVLESHHRSNRKVAAIGVGMGGSMAYEAAIKRTDLEASIAFGGFPQRYLKQFDQANTPILALYGSDDPYIKPVVVKALKQVLNASPLNDEHEVKVMEHIKHEFFTDTLTNKQEESIRAALDYTLDFLEAKIGKLPDSSEFDEII